MALVRFIITANILVQIQTFPLYFHQCHLSVMHLIVVDDSAGYGSVLCETTGQFPAVLHTWHVAPRLDGNALHAAPRKSHVYPSFFRRTFSVLSK